MSGKNRNRYKGAVCLGLASLLWMFGPQIPLDRYFAQSATPVIDEPAPVTSHATRAVSSEKTALPLKLLTEPSLNAIAECLPEFSSKASFSTLRELIEELRSLPSADLKIETQNLHLTTPERKELRMMMAPSESSESDELEAQLFSVDKEGLPVFEKWPPHIDSRDIESAKKYFLNQGELIFHETQYGLNIESHQINGKLIYDHDRLLEVELAIEGHFLGCSKPEISKPTECKCLL